MTDKISQAAREAARKTTHIHYFSNIGKPSDNRFCATCDQYLTDDVHLSVNESEEERAAAIIQQAIDSETQTLREALGEVLDWFDVLAALCDGMAAKRHTAEEINWQRFKLETLDERDKCRRALGKD